MSRTAKLSHRLASAATRGHALLGLCWHELFADVNAALRFRAYMVETYHYIRFSVPFMRLAVRRIARREPLLARYLLRHIKEEAGHDAWMLSDLECLGFDATKVAASPPLPRTRAIAGAQLVRLEYGNPVSYFGYIYALESGTRAPAEIIATGTSLNIPKKALSTFLRHAEVDPDDHLTHLCETLDSVPFEPCAADDIVDNARETFEAMAELIHELAHILKSRLAQRLNSLQQMKSLATGKIRPEFFVPAITKRDDSVGRL